MLRFLAAAAVVGACAWGPLTQATAANSPSEVERLLAHDEKVLASEIHGAAARASGKRVLHGPRVRILELAFAARPGKLDKYGGYLLELDTSAEEIESVTVFEFETRRPYHLHEAASAVPYRFDIQSPDKLELTYLYAPDIGYSTRPLPASEKKYDEAELTGEELDPLFNQAQAVIKQAETHAPVREEEELHPGVTCLPPGPPGDNVRC